jgi:glutathione S-transferase
MTEPPIILHGAALSGHTHRVALLLRALEIPYRLNPTPAEVRRTADFLRLNPLGQIPVLEDGPVVIADSNAMLVYLAKRRGRGTGWLPEEPLAASRVQRWLSIAAGELMHGPAIARAHRLWGVPADHGRAVAIADRLFRFMEEHLAGTSYLASEQPTIADLACYAYTAHAPEGGISLQSHAAIRRWLARIEALPRFEPMPAAPPAAG